MPCCEHAFPLRHAARPFVYPLTACAGVTQAISRAMTQNKELKAQLMELQDGFIQLSNKNMRLASQQHSQPNSVAETLTPQTPPKSVEPPQPTTAGNTTAVGPAPALAPTATTPSKNVSGRAIGCAAAYCPPLAWHAVARYDRRCCFVRRGPHMTMSLSVRGTSLPKGAEC